MIKRIGVMLIVMMMMVGVLYPVTTKAGEAEEEYIYHNDRHSDGTVEELKFVDNDGVETIVKKVSNVINGKQNYRLIIIKNGVTIKDINDILTESPSMDEKSTFVKRGSLKKVYIGTAASVTYIGPEYKTISDLMSLVGGVFPSFKLTVLYQFAKKYIEAHVRPTPMWIKKVTDTYEVRDVENVFLGYYFLRDCYYAYDHSDTTGSDFKSSEIIYREDTTPGV